MQKFIPRLEFTQSADLVSSFLQTPRDQAPLKDELAALVVFPPSWVVILLER